MSQHKTVEKDETERHFEDGRRKRSHISRQKIVHAMIAEIKAGNFSPSAATVADVAGVGHRTVYRHFDDMEALYRSMSEIFAQKHLPVLFAPFKSPKWQDQFSQMCHRRFDIYEDVMPLRIAANLKRYQSETLMKDYERFIELERSTLKAVLPERIHTNKELFASIVVSQSFQSWKSFRLDHQISVPRTRKLMMSMSMAILEKESIG